MEKNRLLELAIQELERRRAALSAEIDTLRSELNGTAPRPSRQVKAAVARARRKGPKSAAARKAQSLRMKKYWAAKRAKAAKAKAAKKALSLKMKEVWKKRKAGATKRKG